MLKEASNQVCFRGTVAAKALDWTFKKERLLKLIEPALELSITPPLKFSGLGASVDAREKE
jgi:hypothetical protein